MTHEGAVVVDAVAHAYDFTYENALNDHARSLIDGTYEKHKNMYSPPEYICKEEKFKRKTSAEDLENLTFEESDVDFAIYHAVELGGFFDDWLMPLDVGQRFKENNPGRVALYGYVDPLEEGWEQRMERQVEEVGVDGIKIYPSAYRDGQHLQISLQDPKTGRAVLEKAEELGVQNIGIHKILPLLGAPMNDFRVDDLDRAAPQFPEIDFELVHAGYSFLEESVFAISRHENVYANLESTMGLLHAQPRQFARLLGEMLKWAGAEKLLLATGSVVHPQAVVESFWEFDIPEQMKQDYGYPDLTQEMKERIMGLNALELHGIDPADVPKNEIEGHRPEPWSYYE